MLDKLHILISIIAGITYTIYALLNNFKLSFWAQNFIIAIILFYILGIITRNYLKKSVFKKDDSDKSVKDQNSNDTEKKVSAENDLHTKSNPEQISKVKKLDFNEDE